MAKYSKMMSILLNNLSLYIKDRTCPKYLTNKILLLLEWIWAQTLKISKLVEKED